MNVRMCRRQVLFYSSSSFDIGTLSLSKFNESATVKEEIIVFEFPEDKNNWIDNYYFNESFVVIRFCGGVPKTKYCEVRSTTDGRKLWHSTDPRLFKFHELVFSNGLLFSHV